MLRFLILLAALPSLATAGEWDASGFVGVDSRSFWQTPQFSGQSNGGELSLMVQPEIRWREGDQRITLVGFARLDGTDSERTHGDIREAYWALERDDWDLTIGLNKVYWGVTESRHLVDVINQSDLVEDIDTEDKLGQPMINLNLQRDWGLIGIYLLPGFRERTFPGVDARLRTPFVVEDEVRYRSSAEDLHTDVAIRYSHYFGDIDIGLHVFRGTSREPTLYFEGGQLIPEYEQMTQIGLDIQYTREAWLWKLEATHRNTDSDNYTALVAGFEYSFYGITDAGADLGILAEWLYDDQKGLVLFDNDIFIGSRLAMNNADDSSLLAGVIFDPDTRERSFSVEAETRINDHLTAELRLRTFSSARANDSLSAFDKDDYLQLRLTWYF